MLFKKQKKIRYWGARTGIHRYQKDYLSETHKFKTNGASEQQGKKSRPIVPIKTCFSKGKGPCKLVSNCHYTYSKDML